VHADTVRRYAVAILASGFGAVLWNLEPQRVAPSPIGLFLAIVMFVSWYGGFGPGLVAGLIGLFATDYAYVFPVGRLGIPGVVPAFQLTLFFALAVGISWLNGERIRLLVRERGARRSAERLATERTAMLDQMSEAVLMTDPSGNITLLNEAALRILGRDVGIGQSYRDIVSQFLGDDQNDVISQVLAGQRESAEDRVLERVDGSHTVVRSRASPVQGSDGSLVGVVATFADVTAERDLQSQKQDLLASLAHDLKNPLTAIKGMAQILLRLTAPDRELARDALRDRLTKIDVKVDEVVELVNHLLAAARTEAVATPSVSTRCDLVALVRDVVEPLQAATESHSLDVETEVEQLIGDWDATALRRALENLLSNAIKYSPDGGRIQIHLNRHAGWASLSVRDQGVGIAPDEIDRIFEPYERGSNTPENTGGSGIGLATVRRVAEDMGGSVDAAGELGKGSVFTVRLPIRKSA